MFIQDNSLHPATMSRFIFLLGLLVFVGGCDSRYKIAEEARENSSLSMIEATTSNERGFTEKNLADGRYLITVQGGGVDTWTRLKDVGLWRAAQIGQHNGAQAFTIGNIEQKMTCTGAPDRSDPRIEFKIEFDPKAPVEGQQVYRVDSILSAFEGSEMFPTLTRRERARNVQANRMACGMVLGR